MRQDGGGRPVAGLRGATDLDPMEAAGMPPEDVDAYWITVTDPETFDHNDW